MKSKLSVKNKKDIKPTVTHKKLTLYPFSISYFKRVFSMNLTLL